MTGISPVTDKLFTELSKRLKPFILITISKAAEWDAKAKDLAGRFIKNFVKYESNAAGKALVAAGPQL